MTTSIKAYSKIEACIAALQQQYSHQPDCSTTEGFEQCKKDYRSIRKVETSLEKERKVQGDEARKHVALVNTEAKQIQERLEEISAPFKQARDVHQAKIDKEEKDRVNGIEERIQNINNFVLEAHGTDSEGVSAIIESIDLIDCADNFDEFTADALKTKQDVLEQLGQILQQKSQAEAAERERLAAERGRLEAERKAAIDQRISNLRMIPLDFINKTAKEISAKIDSLKAYVIPAEDFGDRHQEAVGAQSQVIEQLGMALQQAVKLEEAEASIEKKPEASAPIAESQTQKFTTPTAIKQPEILKALVLSAVAQLSWELNVECPHCKNSIDLADCDDDGIYSGAIFNNDWDRLKGVAETCGECDTDFEISKVVY